MSGAGPLPGPPAGQHTAPASLQSAGLCGGALDSMALALAARSMPLDGARVQHGPRRLPPCSDAVVQPKPEVSIGRAQGRCASDGSCTGPATRAFAQWIARARSAAAMPG